MRHLLSLLCLAMVLLSGCGPAPAPAGSTLTLAVASSMQFAMEDLLQDYRAAHPGLSVRATYGSSGNFSAQIRNGAPFDLFLAADMAYPAALVRDGFALDPAATGYATGGLVLWVPSGSPLDVRQSGIATLTDPAVRKIAIANPALAPYGAAAVAALKNLGVYGAVEPKLVLGDNIAQAAQFVESGAADIGVLALSHALADPMKNRGSYWSLPADSHPPLEQGVIIVKATPDPAAARAFHTWLLSEAATGILERHGFRRPTGLR